MMQRLHMITSKVSQHLRARRTVYFSVGAAIGVHLMIAQQLISAAEPIAITGEALGETVIIGLNNHAHKQLAEAQAQRAKALAEQAKKQAEATKPPVKSAPKAVSKPVQKPQIQTRPKPQPQPQAKPKPKPIQQPVIAPLPATVVESPAVHADVTYQEQPATQAPTPPAPSTDVTPDNSPTPEMTTPETTEVEATEASAQDAPYSASQPVNTASAGNKSQAPLPMNSATRRYIAQLMRHLQRHKSYPAQLKKYRIQGKPVVRFTINRRGEITELGIKTSAQHPGLDKAALDVFKQANPLPPIPRGIDREFLTMSLPIEYSLVND